MRYPIGDLGTKEEYTKLWYSAQEFGATTTYGFHEGVDFNLKSGGDTDLGQTLHAVSDGKIVYYHEGSHPTTGFGKHMVLQCETIKGTRWYHYCHCSEITASMKDVKMGDVIGKLGKSGTTSAHLHFAVFKVDPKTLTKGIDTIAKTTSDLNSWWENPFETLDIIVVPVDSGIPQYLKTLAQEAGLDINNESQVRAFWEKAVKYDNDTKDLRSNLVSVNEALAQKSTELANEIDKVDDLKRTIDQLQEKLNQVGSAKDTAISEATKFELLCKTYNQENIDLISQNKQLQAKVDELIKTSIDGLGWRELMSLAFRRMWASKKGA
jgi:hypothetical protein